jgi:hypothetical protein
MKYFITIHHYFNFNRMKLEDFYMNFANTVVYDFSFKTRVSCFKTKIISISIKSKHFNNKTVKRTF